MSNTLDPDQARRIVGPDLGPNCLQRLSADDTDRQRVNVNTPMQYVYCEIIDNFQKKKKVFLALNINCGYSLEPPQQSITNEYPQSTF